MATMLEVMMERLPDGLEVVKAKQRNGASQTVIDFNYHGTEVKAYLQNTCSPGMVEKNCDFTITAAMLSIALLRDDFAMAMEWKEKQDKVLAM